MKQGAEREDPERLRRTIFIGNVPVKTELLNIVRFVRNHVRSTLGGEVVDAIVNPDLRGKEPAKDDAAGAEGGAGAPAPAKPPRKGYKGGGGIVESARFRSAALAKTAVAPGSDFRDMRRVRRADWRTLGREPSPPHPQLSPLSLSLLLLLLPLAQASFIQGKFDTEVQSTMNAYVVLSDDRFIEPALTLNNQLFEGHHLRVDRADRGASVARVSEAAKRCIFVGQLPFTVTEEAVRAFFAERISGGDALIEYVRLPRDRETNRGKGIGYVAFRDDSSVAEALGLNGETIGDRKIRVQLAKDPSKLVAAVAKGDKTLPASAFMGRRGAGKHGGKHGAGFDASRGRKPSRSDDEGRTEGTGGAAAGGGGGGGGKGGAERSESAGPAKRARSSSSFGGSRGPRKPAEASAAVMRRRLGLSSKTDATRLKDKSKAKRAKSRASKERAHS